MTQSCARQWWNCVSGASDPDEIPALPTPGRMSDICQIFAPVLRVHLNFQADIQDFWSDAYSCLVSLTGSLFPDPVTNFPDFVDRLYRFRERLKPQTVAHCLYYITQFGATSVDDFFLTTFVYVASDTTLAVQTFQFMDSAKFPLWLDFLERRGNVERLYDLFAPHLVLTKSVDCHIEMRLSLASLLTDLVLLKSDLVFHTGIAGSLVKALLGLVDTVPESFSIPFVRLAIQLFEKSFQLGGGYLAVFENSMERLLKLTQYPSSYRSLLYYWLFFRVDAVTPDFFIACLTRHGSLSTATFSLIARFHERASPENVHLVVVFLCRCLSQKGGWARTAGAILLDVCQSGRMDAECRRWFLHYLRLSFMFVRLAAERRKYLRRVLVFLSITADFADIDWVRPALLKNASLAFCEASSFVADFFALEPAVSDDWARDF
jgi:hypothetical protein